MNDDLETRLRRAARQLDDATQHDAPAGDAVVGPAPSSAGPRWRWLVVAAAGVATVVGVGAILATGGDEAAAPATEAPAEGTTAAGTSAGGTVTGTAGTLNTEVTTVDTGGIDPAPHVPTIDELRGYPPNRKWVLLERDGEPFEGPVVPSFEFGSTSSDEAFRGSDGCNQVEGSATVRDGELRPTVTSTAMACETMPADPLPLDGEHLMLVGGNRLEVRSDPGDRLPRLVFKRPYFDDIIEPVGTWRLGDDDTTIEFDDDTDGVVGSCAVRWMYPGRFRVVGLPDDPLQCVERPSETTTAFLTMLAGGPISTTAVGGGSGAVYLADERLVIRLTPTAGTPVTDVSNEAPGPETTMPPDTIDQPDTVPPGVTEPATAPADPPTDLEDALADFGVDPSTVPSEVFADARFCGASTWVLPAVGSFEPTRPARCFAEQQGGTEPLVFVLRIVDRSGTSVTVWRSIPDEGIRSHALEMDGVEWTTSTCASIVFRPYGSRQGPEFGCEDEAVPAPASDPPATLEEALAGLGVELESAPPEVLGDAEPSGEHFCGVDQEGPFEDPVTTAGTCFLEHVDQGDAAVAVAILDFGDGLQVVVHRVHSDGRLRSYSDTSRDPYSGSEKQWTVRPCVSIELTPTLKCTIDDLPSDVELPEALDAVGVVRDSAPSGARADVDAELCGVVDDGGAIEQSDGRLDDVWRCFVDGVEADEPVDAVGVAYGREGDPVVYVFRFTPDDGTVVFIDATRDRFGSRRWSTEVCRSVDMATPFTCSP